jgi:hypothetical protein
VTAKKDLKKRVRERQARTGESYAAARAQVVAEAPEEKESAIPVEEILDLTDDAGQIGIQCRVGVSQRLVGRIDIKAMLLRVRDALLATEDDPALRTLRGVVLRGERPYYPPSPPHDWLGQARRFVARALAGIGGVSEHGNMLAMHVDGTNGGPGVLVIFHVWWRPFGFSTEPPRLFVSAPQKLGDGADGIWTLLR